MITKEEKLKELGLVFNLSRDIIIISDSGRKILEANNSFFEFFKQFKTLDDFNKNHTCICEFFDEIDESGYIYKNSKINDDNWMEYIFNAQGKVLKAHITKNAREYIFNIRISVLDIQKHKYIITMSNITLDEQKNILLTKIIEDQKKYMLLKKDSEQSSKILNFIFNAQNELLILTDGKNLQDTNRAMLEFFGYSSVNEFHKEHDCICDFFEEGKEFLQKIDKNGVAWIDNLIKNKNHSAKVQMKSLSGDIHTFKVSTSAMKIEEDIYLITFSDITQLLVQESILLSQSKKALMGEMIDVIAHQWKQPLSILQTNMSLLQLDIELDKVSNEALKEIVSVSNRQIKHMSETIDEFKSFFRPHHIKSTININSLIESTLTLIKGDLISNSIKITIECDDSIEIECVPNELKHVLINIINNAKDAFNDNDIKKGKEIKITVSKDEDATTIFIQDNAKGIPDSIINSIFNENFSTKTHKSGSGSGIGLYMSKMIIEKINGSLSVKNSEDGACFKIVIPQLIS